MAKEAAYDIVASFGISGFLDSKVSCKEATRRIETALEQYAERKVNEFAERIGVESPNEQCKHRQTRRCHDGYAYCADQCSMQIFPKIKR